MSHPELPMLESKTSIDSQLGHGETNSLLTLASSYLQSGPVDFIGTTHSSKGIRSVT